MLSNCPKCGGHSFIIDETPVENSQSVSLVERCENCGFVVGSCISDNSCDLLSAIDQLDGRKLGGWESVSAN